MAAQCALPCCKTLPLLRRKRRRLVFSPHARRPPLKMPRREKLPSLGRSGAPAAPWSWLELLRVGSRPTTPTVGLPLLRMPPGLPHSPPTRRSSFFSCFRTFCVEPRRSCGRRGKTRGREGGTQAGPHMQLSVGRSRQACRAAQPRGPCPPGGQPARWAHLELLLPGLVAARQPLQLQLRVHAGRLLHCSRGSRSRSSGGE